MLTAQRHTPPAPLRGLRPPFLPAPLAIGFGLFALFGQATATEAPVMAMAECPTEVPDFSYAGYRNGAMPVPTKVGQVINAVDYGVKANDDVDDSLAMGKAWSAARAVDGPVVLQLPPGRIILSEVLRVDRSHVVIRGAGSGSGGTELYFPRPLRLVDRSNTLKELREYLLKNHKYQVEPQNNINALFSEYSWTGGFFWIGPQDSRPAAYLTEYDTLSTRTHIADIREGAQGKLEVQLAPEAKVKAGQVVQIRWFNRQGKNGALIDALYGSERADLKVGANHWQFSDRPLAVQTLRVDRVENGLATLSAPLLHEVSPTLPADIASWEYLEEVGIEELAFVFPLGQSFGHHQEEGYNAIHFSGVFNGWVRNVRVRDADAGVLTYNSANLTLSNIITEGQRRAHYAVHVGNVHNVLVRDVEVFNPVIHTFSINTQASRNVFLRGQAWREPVIDQHAGANHQNLFDQMTFHVQAQRDDKGRASYPIWNGSGAGYWEPGHGRYNTTWNLRVDVEGGALPDEPVTLTGLDEGPDARLVGISGNRPFNVDYRPDPLLRAVNQHLWQAPSLYELQLQHRLRGDAVPTCIVD